jgi:hypothetical protein
MEIKGENVRNVISGLRINLIHALIGGACLVWQCAPLAQRNNKRGAQEPTFTVPPQTLATQSDREGAEGRERPTTPPTANRRPPTPNRDRHRHHVVLLVGSRYIYVITRL